MFIGRILERPLDSGIQPALLSRGATPDERLAAPPGDDGVEDAARRRLLRVLVVLMAAQAVCGLWWRGAYRDADWIKAGWLGNDLVTMAVAVPLLLIGHALVGRGSVRGLLLVLGVLGYSVYNAAFYLFGATLNAFFPLYVAVFVAAVLALVFTLAKAEHARIARSFRPGTPVRMIGAGLVVIGAALALVWIGIWAGHVFGGRPTPIEPDAFRLVAALDLTWLVPGFVAGGVLLWRRHAWGYAIAAGASVQGALYLLVLSVNATIAITRELVPAPGELPIWAGLSLFTTAIAWALLASTRSNPEGYAR